MKLLFQLSLFVIAVAACTQAPAPIETAPPTLVDSEEMPDTPADLALLSWGDLLSQDKPTPSTSIQIGEGETDIVDLWIPETPGPHPVVLMVHGGCWQKSVADRTLMNYAAEDLRQRGLAVWNIEYRGVDEDGGGYPGTYLDVARAADAIGRYAETYDLDPARVAGIGHSAGGHLVTWLATRAVLPEGSPLISSNPES